MAVADDVTGTGFAKVWGADTDHICGVSVRNVVRAVGASGVLNIPQYESIAVLKDGVIFVKAAEDVRKDDQVLIITAGGTGNTTVGSFGGSKGGVAGSGRVDYPNALWLEDTSSGAIGRIRVKFTGTRRTTT